MSQYKIKWNVDAIYMNINYKMHVQQSFFVF